MKTKTILFFAALIISCVAIATSAKAQEVRKQHATGAKSTKVSIEKKMGNYSYRVLPAPNSGFLYVVSQNGRVIFRQSSLQFLKTGGRKDFVKMEQADKAAITTIEKIKRGMLPTLTEEEIKIITME